MWWRTKFADENTIPQQLKHIESELREVNLEYNFLKLYENKIKDNPVERDISVHRMKQEALDLIQSTYTLLHMLGMTEQEHIRMKNEMEYKNWERGYYKKGE